MQQSGHKVNCKEKLSLSLKTPVEQFNQGHHSVSLQHIIPVFAFVAKFGQNSNYERQSFGQIFQMSLRTDRYSLAHVDHCWNVLQLPYDVQITSLSLLKNCNYIVQNLIHRLVVLYCRKYRFFKLHSTHLQTIFVF